MAYYLVKELANNGTKAEQESRNLRGVPLCNKGDEMKFRLDVKRSLAKQQRKQ